MRIIPTLKTRPKNFYFEWLIFHVWTLSNPTFSFEIELSPGRIGIGFVFLYIRFWIGWPMAPYWFYHLWDWADRQPLRFENQSIEEIEVAEEEDDLE